MTSGRVRERHASRDYRDNRQSWPLLDRTQPDPGLNAEDASDAPRSGSRCRRQRGRDEGLARRSAGCAGAGQFFFALSFSSLTRRIVSLNLAGLVALVASILYLSQFRAGLIDARAQSLLVQAEIIAGAIAASATVETNAITIDPGPPARSEARRKLRRAGRIFRARFPDQSGARRAGAAPADLADQDPRPHLRPRRRLILDSRSLYGRGDVLRFELPPPSAGKARDSSSAP